MSTFGTRQPSSSFMRINGSECSTSPAASLKHHGEGSRGRWRRKLGLKQRGDSKAAKSNKSHSFIKNFRHSFNAKFTILSLVLLVFFMSGPATAVPVDDSSTGGTVDTPTLFDTVTISSNTTTTTCPIFFATFLQDPNFLSCLPLSALLLVRSIFKCWGNCVHHTYCSPPRTRNHFSKSPRMEVLLQLRLLTKHATSIL